MAITHLRYRQIFSLSVKRNKYIFGFLCFGMLIFTISPNGFAQSSGKSDSVGTVLFHYVTGIEGKTHAGRMEFVTTTLRQLGYSYTTMPFDTVLSFQSQYDTIEGNNIIVHVGSGNKKIIIGAHFDAVPGAPGANDNGGGVAVILELLQELKNYPFHHSIDFCFFDQEEAGLIGSHFYVERYDTTYTHLAMINLDVEGTGNEVYVGPVGKYSEHILMRYIREATMATGATVIADSSYPESDHESFAAAGLEDISISVVPHGDAEKLSAWTKSGFAPFRDKKDVPEVLKVMHTPNDKSIYVSPSALFLSFEFTRQTLLSLDAGEP